MPGPSETLSVLEQRLTERLLDFDLLDEAWPRGCTAIERVRSRLAAFDTQLVVLTFVALAAAIWRKPHSARRCGTAPIKRAATFSYPLDMAGSAP